MLRLDRMYVPEVLRTATYVFTGKGRQSSHLVHKREFHRRRAALERQVLQEAKSNSSLFRENHCPACGERSPQAATFANPVGFHFAECPADGTIYMDPVPTESTLARLYNSEAYTYHWTAGKKLNEITVKPKQTRELEHIRRVVCNPNDRKLRLLDVGCATGSFLRIARTLFDVEGVELNDDTAAIARRDGFHVTTGRIEDLPLEPKFDIITMLQLIEHVTEPAALLSRAARLLRPHGVVYINTPAVDSASFRLFRDRHNHVSTFAHVSLLTRASWPLLSRRVGLAVLTHQYCGDRDIALHDLATWYLMRPRFRHRWARYSSRLLYASRLIDLLSFDMLGKVLSPPGNSSYQWVILQKPSNT